MPEAFLRAAPSFKESFFGYSNLSSSSIIDVDFSAIVDGYVVGIVKFACAEKGGVHYIQDHVNAPCRLVNEVFEEAYIFVRCRSSIGHVEYLVGLAVSGDEGVSCETSAGCGACVTYG